MTSTTAPETLSLSQLAVLAQERSERIRVLAEARMNERLAAVIALRR